MSTFKVEIVRIDSVIPHPGADRLDLVKINDWQVVSAKGNFQAGDLAVYFPIDSLLPGDVESEIFGPEAKVKLTNSRVKTIKLRGAISQGLAVKPEVVLHSSWPIEVGFDCTNILKITKYEPPCTLSGNSNAAATPKRHTNPNFRKYGGIENAKNYPTVFQDGEEVIITEKIHGTNFRAGYVPFYADTLFKKLKQWLGLAPKYEFVYGSNNVQLQSKLLYKGFYETNVYAEAVMKYKLKEILKPGEVVYGEIYGDGIQKGYNYGCVKGERKLIIFDILSEGKFLDPIITQNWCYDVDLNYVPILYIGPFNKEKALELRDGPSVLSPDQKVREGCVVRSIKEENSFIGRKMLKFISDNYLLKNQDNESVPH